MPYTRIHNLTPHHPFLYQGFCHFLGILSVITLILLTVCLNIQQQPVPAPIPAPTSQTVPDPTPKSQIRHLYYYVTSVSSSSNCKARSPYFTTCTRCANTDATQPVPSHLFATACLFQHQCHSLLFQPPCHSLCQLQQQSQIYSTYATVNSSSNLQLPHPVPSKNLCHTACTSPNATACFSTDPRHSLCASSITPRIHDLLYTIRHHRFKLQLQSQFESHSQYQHQLPTVPPHSQLQQRPMPQRHSLFQHQTPLPVLAPERHCQF